MATNMAPSNSSHVGGNCCHQNNVQLCEIKEELKRLRHTVDVVVKLLSKLVDVTPDDVQTVVSSSTVSTSLSVPVVDSHSNVNTIDGVETEDPDEAVDSARQEAADMDSALIEIDSSDESENDILVVTNESASSNENERSVMNSSSIIQSENVNKTSLHSSSDSVSSNILVQECDSPDSPTDPDDLVCGMEQEPVSSYTDIEIEQPNSRHSEIGIKNYVQVNESYSESHNSDADVEDLVMQTDSRSNNDADHQIYVLPDHAYPVISNEIQTYIPQSDHVSKNSSIVMGNSISGSNFKSPEADREQTSALQSDCEPSIAEIQSCFVKSNPEFLNVDSEIPTYVVQSDSVPSNASNTGMCGTQLDPDSLNPAMNVQNQVAQCNLESLNSEPSIQSQIMESSLEPVCVVDSNQTDDAHLASVENRSRRDRALQSHCSSPVLVPEESTILSVPMSCESSVSPLQLTRISETVPANNEKSIENVEVKQERLSECDDVNVSTIHEQHSEKVKMEEEGVFISDEVLPLCVVMKREEELGGSIMQENNMMYAADRTYAFNSQNVGGSSIQLISVRNMTQAVSPAAQYSPCQIPSPLKPLFGSALVSKLKKKIQEKIQAADGIVHEVKSSGESENLQETKNHTEALTPINDGCTYIEKTSVTQSTVHGHFYRCKICAKVFSGKIAFHKHKELCQRLQKRYHCNFCPLMFQSRAVLFSHRRLHSTKKSGSRHKCEKCGQEFILKSTLKKHRRSQVCVRTRMKYYRRLPQYFCLDCGEGFLNASNLALHQKLHEVDKTLVSNAAIRKADSSMVISRSIRRYPCGYCNEAFIDRRSVTLHEKLHTDKEFAAFDQQRRMIQRKYQLMMMLQKQEQEQQQQQQQNNSKKFDCKVCGRLYPIELLLDMHTRLHHAIS